MNPFRIDFRIIQTQPFFRMHRIVAHADFREESRCFFVVFRICVRSVDEIKTQIREHHPTFSGFLTLKVLGLRDESKTRI
jgi:hypothetical protein